MLAKAANQAWMRGVACASLLVLTGGCRIAHESQPVPADQAVARTPDTAPVTSPVTPAVTSSVTATTRPPATNRAADAVAWPVDPERTVVTVIVRRAGPLARLGHDHVITSADERGTVWLGASPAESAFELHLPVEGFDVDLPEARAAAGAEFAAPVPDEARAGTRRNLLRPEVLDGARFPSIELRSIAASGPWAQPVIRVVVSLRGARREFEIPVIIERAGDALVAQGELRFNQSDFAITPFSVAGGAIQVADELEVRFRIAAHAP